MHVCQLTGTAVKILPGSLGARPPSLLDSEVQISKCLKMISGTSPAQSIRDIGSAMKAKSHHQPIKGVAECLIRLRPQEALVTLATQAKNHSHHLVVRNLDNLRVTRRCLGSGDNHAHGVMVSVDYEMLERQS